MSAAIQTVLIALIGVAVFVSVSVWVWRKYRGVTLDNAAQAIVDLLRGLFGG